LSEDGKGSFVLYDAYLEAIDEYKKVIIGGKSYKMSEDYKLELINRGKHKKNQELTVQLSNMTTNALRNKFASVRGSSGFSRELRTQLKRVYLAGAKHGMKHGEVTIFKSQKSAGGRKSK